jgi:Tol biopolymer transport system component
MSNLRPAPRIPVRSWTFRLLPLALSCALTGCSKDPAAPTGGGELLIAFGSIRPPSVLTESDIYFYHLNAPGPATMPPNLDTPYSEHVPALSGNGEWLAYNTDNTSFLGFPPQILLYHVPTAKVVIPTAPFPYTSPFNPSLSWDGHYMAFQTQLGGLFLIDVVLVDVAADSVIPTPRLHAYGAADFDPALSGDGKLIAFTTTRDGSYDIALYSVPGDSLIPLPGINTAYDDIAVSISRDGRLLAFESNRPGGVGGFDVYVYDRASSSFLPLPGANTPLGESLPALSPDGRYLAYQTEAEGGGDIRLYDIVLQQLVPVPGLNDPYYPDRQPSLAQLP